MPEPESNANGVCVVALPAEGSPIHGVGDVDKHMTMVWLGDGDEVGVDENTLAQAVARSAAKTGPLTATSCWPSRPSSSNTMRSSSIQNFSRTSH
jgi:hypothetical protein